MKHSLRLFLLGCWACIASGVAFAADIAITTVGQSADGMMVKILMKRLNRDPHYDSELNARTLGAPKALIAVIGGSSKGLGAIGLSKEQEKARARALLEAARKTGIKVLVMHIGGDRRRGELTDAFIESTAGLADRLIVVKSGNADAIFTRAKSPAALLTEVDTVQATVPALEATLKQWGISP